MNKESVWDYPRPPRFEAATRRVRVQYQRRWLVDSQRAVRVLETSHPPTYYVPPADVLMEYLVPTQDFTSYCEWKGKAHYYDLVIGAYRSARAAWFYPEPTAPYQPIKNYVAFYPGRVDACYLDNERVQAQPGDFYGGWITEDIEGPFKGGADTVGW